MNRDSFETYVARELAPALRPGQIVRRGLEPVAARLTADNLSSHKSARVIDLLRAQGNDLIFLPPYSPDLNPIEIIRAFTRTDGVHALIFSKLKTLIRKAAARTCHALWTQVGAVCDLFQPQECRNYFMAAGYGLN